MKLRNWAAKRAGKGITATGTDHRGREHKIVGIEAITVVKGKVIATDMDKKKHELVIEPPTEAEPA